MTHSAPATFLTRGQNVRWTIDESRARRVGLAFATPEMRHVVAERGDQREKLDLLSRVERVAAESVRPPIDRYRLVPWSDAELAAAGVAWIGCLRTFDWRDFIADIAERYPQYLLDFETQERMVPDEGRPAVRVLNEHEVAAIEFARKELAGGPAGALHRRRTRRRSGIAQARRCSTPLQSDDALASRMPGRYCTGGCSVTGKART